MARHALRRGDDPLSRSWGRQFIVVDELDLHKSLKPSRSHDEGLKGSVLLTPINEEAYTMLCNTPLAVHVTVKFNDPAIRSVHNQTYYSSSSFDPTDRLCRGLVRRIEHCSEEFITRKDSDALHSIQCLRKGPKPVRFELTFNIILNGHSKPWVERSFRSYQKQPLTTASANDLLHSTHSIVGLFFKRHDTKFHWTGEPPLHAYLPVKPERFTPPPTGPLDLACIPGSRFIETTQSWEFVPGYTLELTLRSNNPARCQPNITRMVSINSVQTAPLNRGLGENLLWQADRSVQEALDQKKNTFDLTHANCNEFDGVRDCDCQHIDVAALDLELRIVNNLGPIYAHLHHSIQSQVRLFTHPDGLDCDNFLDTIRERCELFRDKTDKKLEKMDDFDFRIVELIGHGWHKKNCARFIIDGKQNYTRQTIQALLDRIRTGVGDVLREHDVAIRMIAYKRGHLVLDKALIARDHLSAPVLDESRIIPEDQSRILLDQLTARIQKDIDLICKDTCSLDDIPTVAPPFEPTIDPVHLRTVSSGSFFPRSLKSKRSYQTPPGSPKSFKTYTSSPPEVPSRKRPSRVFPLVPSKYSVTTEKAVSTDIPVWDSTLAINLRSGPQAFGATRDLQSPIDVRAPSTIDETRGGNATQSDIFSGLKPAAELFVGSKAADCDADSNSTHSSMPPLTESDGASPGQSVLVTPSCVRSSSSTPRGLPFVDDLAGHDFSTPLTKGSSASSRTSYSELRYWAEPKTAAPLPNVAPSGRPMTPPWVDVFVDTPKASKSMKHEETPLAHHQLEESRNASIVQDRDVRAVLDTLLSNDYSSGTSILDLQQIGSINSIIALKSSEIATPRAEAKSFNSVQQGLPTEGWLLCYSEPKYDLATSSSADHILDNCITATATESSSLETLGSPKKQEPITSILAELQNSEAQVLEEDSGLSDQTSQVDSYQTPGNRHTASTSSDPEEVPETVSLTGSGKTGRISLTMEEETIDSEAIIQCLPTGHSVFTESEIRPMGLSEKNQYAGHVIPLSDSGIAIAADSESLEASGSEFEKTHANKLESYLDKSEISLQDLGHGLVESGVESASGPFNTHGNERGVQTSLLVTEDSLSTASETSVSLLDTEKDIKSNFATDQLLKPVPTSTSRSGRPSQVTTSVPIHRYSQCSVSYPHPSLRPLGLSNNFLQPPMPLLSNSCSITAATKNSSSNRTSWSSSSEWEDYVSEARQSSDSVDTIIAFPYVSDEDDGLERPESSKRLRTPTAGLLGLQESRWANFGIRGALTGTHAFDGLSATPTSNSLRKAHDKAVLKHDLEAGQGSQAKTLTPPKTFHLKHKKSIGSIIFMGTKPAKLPKKKRARS